MDVIRTYGALLPFSFTFDFDAVARAVSAAQAAPFFYTWCAVFPLMFFVEFVLVMKRINYFYYYAFVISQKFTSRTMRNASLGFAECVRPGGKPTRDHSLHLYNLPAIVTSIIFGAFFTAVIAITPVLAYVRLFYREHREGVNRDRRWFGVTVPLWVVNYAFKVLCWPFGGSGSGSGPSGSGSGSTANSLLSASGDSQASQSATFVLANYFTGGREYARIQFPGIPGELYWFFLQYPL